MVILSAKLGLFGNTRDCTQGQGSPGKTRGKSREQRREMLFYRGKERGVGRTVINRKSIGVNWELDVWWLLIGWVVARGEESFFLLLG